MTTKRLAHTGIEYAFNPDGSLGYGWNCYPGCLHKPQGICPLPNCWAEVMWKRQMGAAAKKGITLPDFHHPHLIPELLLAPLSVKKPSTILVNFMGDLFGDWVNPNMLVSVTFPGGQEIKHCSLSLVIKDIIRHCPQHTLLFLTKNPKGLIPWSPFPDNAWVGVTVCNQKMFNEAIACLAGIDAKHKWLSIEPLLGEIDLSPLIGYNYHSPIKHGDEDEANIIGGDNLQGSGAGGTRDRRGRSNLESEESDGKSMGSGRDTKSLRETAGGTRHGHISPSQSNGRLEANLLPGTPACMEALSRPDTIGHGHQSKEREQKRQPSEQSGSGDILPEHSTCSACSESGADRPKRNEKRNGKTKRGSSQRNTVFKSRYSQRDANEEQSPDKRTGEEIRRQLSYGLGYNQRAPLEISFIVIGAQTNPVKYPEILWVRNIIKAADQSGVKVWLKNNLFEFVCKNSNSDGRFWGKEGMMRQEKPI